MEKQISIIIPTYNMEKYIGKCLDSLLIPEFDQVEVLVVNDGSKDRSSEIAHEYADRYPDSIRIIDKENGNYGSCINAALPQCTGRYVKILDADDAFDTAAFSEFVRLLPNCHEDILISNYVEINDSGYVLKNHTISNWGIEPNVIYDASTALNKFLKRYIDMHRIAYSRKLFNKFVYTQTEGISYTDTEWAIIPLSYCQTFRFLELNLYKYLVGREGQTMDTSKISKSLNHMFRILQRIVLCYCDCPNGSIRRKILYYHIRNRHKYVYLTAISIGTKVAMSHLREYDESLKVSNMCIYNAVGKINYAPRIHYRIFDKIRKYNYPTFFELPFYVKFLVSLDSKINAIRNNRC